MPIETESGAAAPDLPRRPRLRLNYTRLVDAVFALFIFSGVVAFVEPSPYDFVSLIAMPLWFIGGFRLHRGTLPFIILIILYNVAGFIALVPYWNEPDPTIFMLQSLYLAITALFFAAFFNERTNQRVTLCLKAFAASSVVAAAIGIGGYFNIADTGEIFATYGRAAGTFKDPNVFGSYLIMGALYLLQILMIGRPRSMAIAAPLFIVVVLGIFFSFSRGSLGAFLLGVVTMVGLAFVTTRQAAMRGRIIIGMVLALLVAALALACILSIDSVRELFLQRAQAPGEEYDDLRFFNQAHALPMLLDRPNGFGPLRFRLWFDLDPHSSYVNAFASYGWFGGFTFLTLVAATTFVGFRLTLLRSPYQTLAQVVWPSLMGFLLQGFQIDIDHWRHVYLMFGMLWGIEAARQRWAGMQSSKASPAAKTMPRPRPSAAAIRALPEHQPVVSS